MPYVDMSGARGETDEVFDAMRDVVSTAIDLVQAIINRRLYDEATASQHITSEDMILHGAIASITEAIADLTSAAYLVGVGLGPETTWELRTIRNTHLDDNERELVDKLFAACERSNNVAKRASSIINSIGK